MRVAARGSILVFANGAWHCFPGSMKNDFCHVDASGGVTAEADVSTEGKNRGQQDRGCPKPSTPPTAHNQVLAPLALYYNNSPAPFLLRRERESGLR